MENIKLLNIKQLRTNRHCRITTMRVIAEQILKRPSYFVGIQLVPHRHVITYGKRLIDIELMNVTVYKFIYCHIVELTIRSHENLLG